MKRCPECDFIYEDDQRACDMDGEELVHEPRWFPLPTTAGTPPMPAKSRWRSLVLLAIATCVLGAVLSVDYYNFRRQAAPDVVSSQPTAAQPEARNSKLETSSPRPAPNPTAAPQSRIRSPRPVTSATPGPSPTGIKAVDRAAPVVKVAPTPLPSPRRAEEHKTETENTSRNSAGIGRPAPSPSQKPAAANQKKESRLRSFLKKTGRILKKPFQL